MPALFLDTAFLVAHMDPRDSLHERAIQLIAVARNTRAELLTTPLVLGEFLAHFSRGRPDIRFRAVEYANRLVREGSVVALTPELLQRGLDFYASRLDQRYSLTDCVSMLVCKDLGITDVLTSDADFEHEGLRILLKDD